MSLKEIVNHATSGTRGLAYAVSAFTLGQIGDVISTYACLNLGGYETNPIIHSWIETYGFENAIGLKLLCASSAAITISIAQIVGNKINKSKNLPETKLASYGLYGVSLVISGVIINNFYCTYQLYQMSQ